MNSFVKFQDLKSTPIQLKVYLVLLFPSFIGKEEDAQNIVRHKSLAFFEGTTRLSGI